ncbi:molybdate ABC transporter substrate-binding protein [Solimonas sp. K1W22B-7]|uniref:molybdate ABC transporter substrate-binding protein n=1 Tax=Solimonas sp. K1W22B-7 TaxID=2303331 RepID=UPI000E32D954|nr:molybdate ABC transporter substrate-binding protein [Solimonas sp. K1W22B-7]AXQ29651.1 molybdate ABC transporter substrate-binding protein [Solimonas sp. K1W22B-7]
MRLQARFLAASLLLCSWSAFADPARVYAAASLTNAVTDIGAAWQKAGHEQPVLVFGASSALAKQVEAGAPADLFMSADLSWMDYLEQRNRIAAGSRSSLLGNTLVLIAPKGKGFPVTTERGFDLAGAFKGKLCTGEPGVVPVGIYAKEALSSLGWWDKVSSRIVGTDDVRTALAFVERGECPLGIVYATDAAISQKVEVIASFPAGSHKPIVYPVALVKTARAEGGEFLQYVKTSPEAAAIFRKYGFTLLSTP